MKNGKKVRNIAILIIMILPLLGLGMQNPVAEMTAPDARDSQLPFGSDTNPLLGQKVLQDTTQSASTHDKTESTSFSGAEITQSGTNEFIEEKNHTLYEKTNVSESKNSVPWVTRFANTTWLDHSPTAEEVSRHVPPPPPVGYNITCKVIESESTDLNWTTATGQPYIIKQESLSDQKVVSDETLLPRDGYGGLEAPATPLTPAKEGHWFIKTGYSKLKFKFDAQGGLWGDQYKVHIKLERNQDIYARRFRVYLDGVEFFSAIIGSQGFDDDIWTPFIYWHGEHTITLQINWCGWRSRQWKLTYLWIYDSNDWPQDVNGEYFPVGITAPAFEYQVLGGTDTILSITIHHGANPYTQGAPFAMSIYFGEQLISTIDVPNGLWSFELDIGDYMTDSLHTLKLVYADSVVSPGYRVIVVNALHHLCINVEVDYMPGHDPRTTPDVLPYLESWFKVYDYHGIRFHVDEETWFLEWLDDPPGGFERTRNQYFDHYHNGANDFRWIYLLFCHYAHIGGGGTCGVGVFIADQYYQDSWWPPLDWERKAVLLHEFGHVISIPETHCGHYGCVYGPGGIQAEPWICEECWRQRVYPPH